MSEALAGTPLSGRRVLVTRALQQAGKLSDGLKALGAEPVEVPVLEIRPPDSYEALDNAIRKLDAPQGFDWLILTSANTAVAVAARCALLHIDVADLKRLSVAAVGSATAEAARKADFRVTVVPESYQGQNSEGLVAALGQSIVAKRVLLARAKVARDVIPDALTAAGVLLTVVDAYQTVLPDGARDMLVEALRVGVDVATFTSSSSVRNLAEVAREAGVAFPMPGVKAVSIGPVTSATLREFGWEPMGEAAASDIPGLIAAVVRVVQEQGTGNRE